MSQPVNRADADRNLLFGILAVQVNFIDRDALVAAMHAWVLDKQKPLGQILLAQRKLTAEQLAAIDTLIVQHLKLHGDKPELSLQAINTRSITASELLSTNDIDVQTSVAKLASNAAGVETATYFPPPPADARYQKLRHHAGGGLGDVFVANDTELHREVALKEIKPKFADDIGSRHRFVVEAEITGGLEHPGIVPVYGLGAYEDGRPFYAMRFIRGDNLKEAIEQFHAADKQGRDGGERSLAFRQLLRRFVDVCNAVAYAHNRGVLHRDLKPANVMLGKFGETLIVDWGLAKTGAKDHSTLASANGAEVERTLHPASGSSIDPTLAGSHIGSPPFMSPEQAEGRTLELGPASDIYSLGSTLYTLLAGKMPYEAPTKEEVLAKVRRGVFTPPKEVKPQTPAALDAVCRKAMSFHPRDRYATTLELAADVEHWLADEPVAVYAEPWTARTTRWARRHRTAVVSAGVVLLCATIGLAISTALISAEQRRTAEQKRVAEANYALAQIQTGVALQQKQVAVNNYKLARDQSFSIIELMESSEAEIAARPSLHKTRKDILELVAKACRHYLDDEPEDKELRRRSAQVYRYAANVHRLADEIDAADPLYRDAIKLYEGLAKQFPDETRYGQILSESLRDQAKLQANVGRLKEATETLHRSSQLIEELIAEQPTQSHLRQTLAATLFSLASAQCTRGMYDESSTTAQRAAAIYREFATLPPAKRHPYDPVLLAASLNLVAVCERESGRHDAALEAHREPVKSLFDLTTKPPAGVNPNDIIHFYAACQLEQFRTWATSPNPKRVENAEKGLAATIATWQALAKSFPQVPMYRESLSVAFQHRALLRMSDPARQAEALTDLEESRRLLEKRVQESPNVSAPRGDLGRTYLALGRLAKQSKDPAAAGWFAKATESLERALAQSPDNAHDKKSWAEAKAEKTE